jgi:hypothetical protein
VPKTALTDAGLRSLPPPSSGQTDFWDVSFKAGLFGCRVSRGGTKTFQLKHRNRRFTIGQYPTLSLTAARTEARRLLAEFTLGKVRPHTLPYSQAVQLFIEEKEKSRRKSTADAYKGLLTRLSFTGPVAEITHEEVRRKLGKIKTQGAYNHHLVALKVFFNWSLKRRYVTENPTLGLSKQSRPRTKRILTDDELVALWRAAEQTEGHFGTIVKLLILTGQRRGEIAALKGSYYRHTVQAYSM